MARPRLIAGFVVGTFAALIAWRWQPPTYSSTVILRIPTIHETLGVEKDAPHPLYDNYTHSQIELITSPHALDLAAQGPAWNEFSVPFPAQPSAYYREHLQMHFDGDNDLMRITVTDHNPQATAAALRAITNAYVTLFEEDEAKRDSLRGDLLKAQQTTLTTRIHELEARHPLSTTAPQTQPADDIAAELSNLHQDVDRLTRRLQLVHDQSLLGPRLTILTPGDVPTTPVTDHRVPSAAIAGGTGFLAGIALSYLIAMRRERRRPTASATPDAQPH